jgi:hypothetical protein
MRGNNTVEKLRADILEALAGTEVLDDELAQWIAARVLRALQQKYGASRVYIPAAEKQPIAELMEAYYRGDRVRAICRRLNVSRSTLYKLLSMEAELQDTRTR